ncbi:nucleoside hydrolase-like domain-containing protein [Paenibacillus sp. PL2-23]|uniref:nucleoside hydrolase-like domain-containing protein n=1 Tax=Paenibacillus sp. PL2-23 TaxID=2100729 RepID=UPI0030F51E51
MIKAGISAQAARKPRTVLLLDPELDDLNTLVRYLLYSDQFDTEAFIYQSSIYHWKGDGKGTTFEGNSEHTHIGIGPITQWRWDHDSRFMEEGVDIYARVYTNLIAHSDGYPEPDLLQSRIYEGNVSFPGDMSQESPGSNRIKSLILDDKPGPLYLLSGAGMSTIGRALLSIEETYKHTKAWEDIYRHVCRKVILQAFGDQDGVYPGYIRPQWPDIECRDMSTGIWGYGAHQEALPHDQQYLSSAWMKEHVSSVGPFGEFYRVWGDGKIMHQNDRTDFFGFAGLTVEQLQELGYNVWYKALKEPGAWISEGDTSIFMNLINNGLDAHIDGSYGGWGGRGGKDITPDGIASHSYAVARWFGAAQRDFAARMKWTVTPRYEDASHPPIAQLLSPRSNSLVVRPGEVVTLAAAVQDPDNGHVTGRWWRYEEADTYPGAIEWLAAPGTAAPEQQPYPATIPAPGSPEAASLKVSKRDVVSSFTVPHDASSGQTLHFILEAVNHGRPALTSYLRVVLTVQRGGKSFIS